MSTQELFELALLDSLGLLEAGESSAFEAAFAAAPPALQAQIRREQTRFAQVERLLPRVDPPAELRARVVAKVREAMTLTERAEAPVLAGGTLLVPAMFRARSVPRWWRTMALASAAAAFFLGGVALYVGAEGANVRNRGITDQMLEAISSNFGPAFVQDVLFNRDTRRVVFTPAASDGIDVGEATVFVNPEWNKGQFFCRSLKADTDRPLRLALVDEHDQVVEVLSTFVPDGTLERHEFNWSPKLSTGRLAIVSSEDDFARGSILSRADLSKPST